MTINETNTITLMVPSSTIYQIRCLALNSKPDVILNLYDNKTLNSLGNSSNSAMSYTCDTYNLCSVLYQVNFQLSIDSPFVNMTLLTCMDMSVFPQVDLNNTITRNVLVINNQSKQSI